MSPRSNRNDAPILGEYVQPISAQQYIRGDAACCYPPSSIHKLLLDNACLSNTTIRLKEWSGELLRGFAM